MRRPGLGRWALLAAMFCALSPAVARSAPTKAPWFSLESTQGGLRTPANFAGRVVLLMYEDRDSGEVNAALKAEVKRRIDREPGARDLVVLPVADVRKYDYFPARKIVRRAVIDRAQKLGTEILLDWRGDILRAYGFVAPGSNVVLLGREGTLLYRQTVPLDAPERARFHAALTNALNARHPEANASPGPSSAQTRPPQEGRTK
ncbi:MAG TPA: hypothetical protein VGG33_09565 [Polyangia bacterium]